MTSIETRYQPAAPSYKLSTLAPPRAAEWTRLAKLLLEKVTASHNEANQRLVPLSLHSPAAQHLSNNPDLLKTKLGHLSASSPSFLLAATRSSFSQAPRFPLSFITRLSPTSRFPKMHFRNKGVGARK